MSLSSDLISQFVKVTNDNQQSKKETTVYGTMVEYNGTMYVQIDGSELLTPVTTTANTKAGERVTVMIKNHTATVTGNITSPSARIKDVEGLEDAADKIAEFEIVLADKVDTATLNVEKGRIDDLLADTILVKERITANEGDIDKLQTANITVTEGLTAANANITKLQSEKLDVLIAEATYATIADLDVTNANVYNLEATYGDFASLTTQRLDAIDAIVKDLDAESLSATYANIDFSNIGKAAMEYFYSTSGLIENVTVADGTITGRLVGVTLSGDVIEGNTVVADKLVIKGEDGLYYKLNTDGITTSAEQTEYNSLNGNIILAKSITAEKVNVSDLVAFDATIGGFTITEDSIYSEVKDSEDNTTRGVYFGADGQVNFGDESNFIKYYRDSDGSYKLAISAASIMYALNGKQYSIEELGRLGDYVRIATYEGEPCIELGEGDSDFKLRITNTRILFMEGTNTPAYFTNQSMHIKKAVIEDELQQGGFVWKARNNGNLGLVWKGATE